MFLSNLFQLCSLPLVVLGNLFVITGESSSEICPKCGLSPHWLCSSLQQWSRGRRCFPGMPRAQQGKNTTTPWLYVVSEFTDVTRKSRLWMSVAFPSGPSCLLLTRAGMKEGFLYSGTILAVGRRNDCLEYLQGSLEKMPFLNSQINTSPSNS